MRRLAPLALLPLLLLPNFLFLIPDISQVSGSQGKSTLPNEPLSPGTVTSLNHWALANQSCPTNSQKSEALLARTGGWSALLHVPTLILGHSSVAQNITQFFSLMSNGTLYASDDRGNRLALSVPFAQFKGTATITLKSNSTEAVESFLVSSGRSSVANITLIFSVYRISCLQAGIKLDIFGDVNWGPSKTGQIQLRLGSPPLTVKGYRAWMSNSSGVALGIDWSDSSSLDPSYVSSSNSVTWTVGSKFDIDPETITTTTNPYAIVTDDRNIFFANGRYWVFYCGGTGGTSNYYYATSLDGVTWQTVNLSTNLCGLNGFHLIQATFDGTYVHYIREVYTTGLAYRRGIPNPDGTVFWSAPEQSITGSSVYDIAVDTGGHAWITYGNGGYKVAKDSAVDGTWTMAAGFPATTNSGFCALQALTTLKMIVFCGGEGGSNLYASLYNSGWQTTQLYTSYAMGTYLIGGFETVSRGDVAYIVFGDKSSRNLYSVPFNGTTNRFGSTLLIGNSGTGGCMDCETATSIDARTGNIFAIWPYGGARLTTSAPTRPPGRPLPCMGRWGIRGPSKRPTTRPTV